MFDMLPMTYQFNLMQVLAAPFFQLGTLTNKNALAGTFFTGAFPLLTTASSSTLRATYIEYNPHRNYVMQWNMNIQQQLTPSLTAMIGYVGSRGVHMPYRTEDADMVIPTLTPAGYLWPCGPDGKGNPCAKGFLPTGTQCGRSPSVPRTPSTLSLVGRTQRSIWGTPIIMPSSCNWLRE